MKKSDFSVQFILVCLLAVAAFAFAGWEYFSYSRSASASASGQSVGASTMDVEVDALVPNIAAEPTLFQQEQTTRLAIRNGNFVSAEQQVQLLLNHTHMGRWHFAPFVEYIEGVAAAGDNAFVVKLNQWVAATPNSSLAHLVRANFHFDLAWRIRGADYANNVDADRFKSFDKEMALAKQDVETSILLEPNNPASQYLALLVARDSDGGANLEAVFQRSIERFPQYYPLYANRLITLSPKWYGSVKAMKQFVHFYAGSVPDTHPLKMLNLQLYAGLLGVASNRCSSSHGVDTACVAQVMGKIVGADETQAARNVIESFARRDQLDAANEVARQLDSIIWVRGGAAFAAAFLQFFANRLDSDTQLVTDKAGNNHYLVDLAAANFWYRQGYYDNAVTLGGRAVKDLSHTSFPDVASANAARLTIYRRLLSTYNKMGNLKEMAVYGMAAARLQGGYGADVNHDNMTCFALMRLKQNAKAVTVCSAIVAVSNNKWSLFYRARAYDAAGQDKKALADYRVVADSDISVSIRVSAIIDMDLIYGQQKDDEKALDVLNRYRELFVEGRVDRDDLAVYFNNRCYSKMKLGRLQSALDDCTVSLQYGNIPDAVAKQQQLIQALAKKSTPSI